MRTLWLGLLFAVLSQVAWGQRISDLPRLEQQKKDEAQTAAEPLGVRISLIRALGESYADFMKTNIGSENNVDTRKRMQIQMEGVMRQFYLEQKILSYRVTVDETNNTAETIPTGVMVVDTMWRYTKDGTPSQLSFGPRKPQSTTTPSK